MRLVFPTQIRQLAAVVVSLMTVACAAKDTPATGRMDAASRAGDLPRLVRAGLIAANGARARWVSVHESCVIPFDAPDVLGCGSRDRVNLPDSIVALLREKVGLTDGVEPLFTCIRVSREISDGDSTLVSVNTTEVAVVDGVAASRTQWIWFRHTSKGDSTWIAGALAFPEGDVRPLTDSTRC